MMTGDGVRCAPAAPTRIYWEVSDVERLPGSSLWSRFNPSVRSGAVLSALLLVLSGCTGSTQPPNLTR